MTYKLVAIDLDGTLLNSSGQVAERTGLAVKAATAAGIVVVPATARWYQAAVRPFAALGLQVAAIAAAGADIRAADGAVIEQCLLDGDLAVFLADICDRAGWVATLSTPERAYRRANELPAWAANAPEWLKPVTTLQGDHLASALSVMAEAAAGDEHMPHLEAWAGRMNLFPALAFNGDRLLTITAPGVDKGSGLLALCRHLGIEPSESVAIGDSEGDIPMFKVAGLSVAMGDGTAAAREAASQITGTADEDGVAQFLESLIQ